jgi:hypothetical protein
VQAVATRASEEGVSITELARALKLDKASASRRWNSARARGYLKNLETGRGKPARIVLADPLPDDIDVLPTVEALRHNLDDLASSPRHGHPPPPDSAVKLEGEQPQHAVDAETATAPPSPALTRPQALHALTLDEALRDPNLHQAIGIDAVTVTIEDADEPDPERVLLERHEIGLHAIELWETPFELPRPPQPPRSTHSPAGKPIGICIRCGAGVGDDEWTFAAWDGKDWRFSGRTLPEAQRLAALRPLLCSGCAIKLKHGLITQPNVSREQEYDP